MDFKADNLSISDTIDDVNIDDAEKMIKAMDNSNLVKSVKATGAIRI